MSSNVTKYEEKVVLSYYDCLLRNKDVDLLRGPHWLNDALIGFYFEYLEHKFDDFPGDKRAILFVSPELTQLLKLTNSSDYEAFLEPLNAGKHDYVLFPLNNCESRDAAGGSHWSLLVFSKKEKTSFHLDSCKGTNRQTASKFGKKIMDYFLNSHDKNVVEETDCPQQENGYDCGLFAVCLADIIVRHVSKVPEIRECKFEGVKSLVRTKRDEMLELIEEIKNTQQ